MKKYIYNGMGECYGYLEEDIGYYGYTVGDVIVYTHNWGDKKIGIGVIVRNCDNTGYSIYGWCSGDISKHDGYKISSLVIPSKFVTEKIIHHLTELIVKEIEEKEMTLAEIEQILGYKIKIINKKSK